MVRVLRKLGTRLSVPISVVTVHAETARRAIELGASIVHDFSGLAFDRELATVANETNVALILGHMRGTPAQWSRLAPLTRLADTVRMDLRASLMRAHQAGIEPRRIVLDPGLEQRQEGPRELQSAAGPSHLGSPRPRHPGHACWQALLGRICTGRSQRTRGGSQRRSHTGASGRGAPPDRRTSRVAAGCRCGRRPDLSSGRGGRNPSLKADPTELGHYSTESCWQASTSSVRSVWQACSDSLPLACRRWNTSIARWPCVWLSTTSISQVCCENTLARS